MTDSDPIPLIAAGFFFSTSICGWICAHLAHVRAVERAQTIAWQANQIHNLNTACITQQAAILRLQKQIVEEGGDLPGDEWKHGDN